MVVRALPSKLHVRSRDALARRFGVDTRALAALRVSLGALVLADLLDRSRDLVAFYTDAGVLPRAALREQSPGLARLSLHTVSGEAWVQVLLFLVAAAVAVALLVGYRTRLATAVSFLLLASLHARNPVLLNGGDSLLRRLLLWGVFLPLGERWSVDALGDGDPRERVASLASAALLLQVVVVYTVNAAFKLRADPWVNGDAMLTVFSLDRRIVLLGDALAQYPTLLKLLGWLWLAMVVSSVLLVLLTGRPRALFAVLFAAMHVGMSLTMRLGLFPLISVAALLPFLPSRVWDVAEARLASPVERVLDLNLDFDPDLDRWKGRSDRVLSAVTVAGDKPGVDRWKRRVASLVVAGLLVFVLAWNAAALGYVAVPEDADLPVAPADHRWDMFAPVPPTAGGWYVVPGRLESGRQLDAFHRSPVRWDRPPDEAYPTLRWLEYLLELRRGAYADYRPYFADYLCRRWNAHHEDHLVEVTVYYVEQPVRLDGPEPTRRVELLRYSCSPVREER